MAKNTAHETERMVITRVFDAPRELVWKAWTDPKYMMQWWGPKGFTAPYCKIDFRVGGKFLCCMRAPDGQEFWNAGEYHEIVPQEKIVSSMYFSDSEGNKVEPAHYGIEHEALDDVHDVITFEDLGNGQTKLTFIGNETMENATKSGQVEGWYQILDKIAAVIAGAGAVELRSRSFEGRPARAIERKPTQIHPGDPDHGCREGLVQAALVTYPESRFSG